MNVNVFKALVVGISLVGVAVGAGGVIRVWSNHSELGKKAKAFLREELAKK